jgi:hypothetical protein
MSIHNSPTGHQPKRICRCGREFESTGRCRSCPQCREARYADWQERYESTTLTRRRTIAEVLVELHMEKERNHTPALDRKIAKTRRRIAACKQHKAIYNEFVATLAVVAYRRGILTEERWAAMRAMHPDGDKYREALHLLFQEVTHRPLPLRYVFTYIDDLALQLPVLRRMYREPGYTPPEGERSGKQPPIEPEQVPHADQAHIDVVAAELLSDIDF